MNNTTIINEQPTHQDSITQTVVDSRGNVNTRLYSNFPTYGLSIVTIIIAIIALFLPQILSNQFKKRQKEKRLANLEVYAKVILQSLLLPLKKQITIMQELSQKIRNIELPDVGYVENFDLSTVNYDNINHRNLYKIFIENKKLPMQDKIKHFRNITHATNFIKSHLELSRINFSTYIDSRRDYDKTFKRNADLILKKWNEYFSEARRNNLSPNDDDFLKGFNKILFNWHTNENRFSIQIVEDLLLNPLKEHCTLVSSDSRSPQIITYVVDAKEAIFQIKNLSKIYSAIFSNEAKEVEKNHKAIQNALQFFD